MSIFQKSVPSVKISKKIDNLQAQLRGIENQGASKGIQIEKAVAEGEIPDKLFTEAANLKIKEDVAKGVLSKMQGEYEAAQTREERKVKAAELDQFQKAVDKGIAGLEKNLEEFVEAAEGLVAKEGAFRKQYAQLFTIPGPAGVDFRLLPHFDAGFITVATTYKLPINTPERALATAGAEAMSNLRAIRNVMSGRIATARNAWETEAPPVAEPSATAPKERVKIIDGQPVDVYLQHKRDARAKRKANEPKVTSRQELIEAASTSGKVVSFSDGVSDDAKADKRPKENVFAQRDREDDAASRGRPYTDFPKGY